MNQTIHFMGIKTFSLNNVIFNQKLLMDITKSKRKSPWLNSLKKQENARFHTFFPSWEVDNKSSRAIICSKWEFWQIYAQWRLIVGDKCGFFATGHLWPSDAPPAVDNSKVHPCLCLAECPVWLFSSVHLAECPPGGLRQPLPVGGLRPGKHSKF